MNGQLLRERYQQLRPSQNVREQIFTLKYMFPEYRGYANAYIYAALDQMLEKTDLCNSLTLSRQSASFQTSPLAISLNSEQSPAARGYMQASGGFCIRENFYTFVDYIEVPVAMQQGALYSEQFKIRLARGNDYFKISTTPTVGGCVVKIVALSSKPRQGRVECISYYYTLSFSIEGYNKDRATCHSGYTRYSQLKAESLASNASQVKQEIRQPAVPMTSRFYVSYETIRKWAARAEKYNEVYGKHIY